MSSPEIWADARQRIGDYAAAINLPVAWPNEPFKEPAPFTANGDAVMWLAVDFEGGPSDAMEIGGGAWDELGSITVIISRTRGRGAYEAAVLRKRIANLFRRAPPVGGLIYRTAVLGEGGPSEAEGKWYPLPLRITYDFQDTETGDAP